MCKHNLNITNEELAWLLSIIPLYFYIFILYLSFSSPSSIYFLPYSSSRTLIHCLILLISTSCFFWLLMYWYWGCISVLKVAKNRFFVFILFNGNIIKCLLMALSARSCVHSGIGRNKKSFKHATRTASIKD